MAFDTLTYAKKLQEAGVPAQQAEAHAGALKELVEGNLATKHDLKEMEIALGRDMKEMEIALRRDMKELEIALGRDLKEMETGLRSDMKEMETRLLHGIELVRREMEQMRRDVLIKLGGIVVAGFTVMAALIGVVIAVLTL